MWKIFRQIRAVILLSIYFVIEFFFVHKLGIQTFFMPNVSVVPPPIKLDIGYLNKLQLRFIYLVRFFLKEQFAFKSWYESILKNIEQRLEAQVKRGELDLSKIIMPIDTYQPGEISADDFREKYVRAGIPVIIKGGCKHTKGYKEWDPDYFGKNYGHFKVNIIDLAVDKHFSGTIKDVIDSRGTERKYYIHNSANIFSYNAELFDDLECRSYEKHMGGQFLGCQLFLGVHRGTGTTGHCANNTNLFYQLWGQKEWTFTHPDYTWLMYPMFNRFFLFCATFCRLEYDEVILEKHFPLQKYCPHYRAVLEPGDLLLNPTWMWHAVNNVTEESIGVASRWIVPTARTNKFFDFIQLGVRAIWRLKFDGLSTPEGEPVIIDENTRSLIKNSDDYADFGKTGAALKYINLHRDDPDYARRQAKRPAGVFTDAAAAKPLPKLDRAPLTKK